MEDNKLWIENAKEHAEIKKAIEDLRKSVEIAPLLIGKVILPLILILGGIIGVDRILSKFMGG